ncbi:glycosyltransferase family 4 protein [Balneola sp. MJW-20]|uniref:glycosyltransferase family 4 protein n=1 Tax=Gracilimonas aurantiaca TaxID=3234185 RepID=UPI0034655EB0
MHIVIQDYGGYRFIYQLALELSGSFEVTYIHSSSSGGANGVYNSRENLNVVDIKLEGHSKSNLFKRRKKESLYGKRVSAYLCDQSVDLMVSTNTPLDAQKIISDSLRDTYHVIWVQDLLSIAIQSILKKKIPVIGDFISKYYHSIEKRCYKSSDQIITISEQLKEELLSWGIPNKIEVLPNWAPVEEIEVGNKNNEFSRKHDLQDKFVVLYSGSLGMKHNPDLIIDAALDLKDISEVHFLVISEGSGADYLKSYKDEHELENLSVLPFQDANVYNSVLATADLNLILLNADAQKYSVPSKAWSAMCSGRPLLTNMNMTNQVSRIISETNSGLVLSSDHSVTDGILKLFENPEVCTEMGNNARRYAELNFKINKIASLFINKSGFSNLLE